MFKRSTLSLMEVKPICIMQFEYIGFTWEKARLLREYYISSAKWYLELCFSLSLSLSYTHTHTHTSPSLGNNAHQPY